MRATKLGTVAWLATAALLASGCGDTSGGRRIATEVYLAGHVARQVREKKDVWVDTRCGTGPGIRFPVCTQLPFVAEVRLHVLGMSERGPQEYDALIGPDPDHPGAPLASVHSSGATIYVSNGWVLAAGRLPMGETGTTQTSSTGTTFVIRATADRDTIYNIKDGDSKPHPVEVRMVRRSEVGAGPGRKPIPVPPGFYLIYPPLPGTELKPQPIPPDDAFLAYVRTRAALGGMKL